MTLTFSPAEITNNKNTRILGFIDCMRSKGGSVQHTTYLNIDFKKQSRGIVSPKSRALGIKSKNGVQEYYEAYIIYEG